MCCVKLKLFGVHPIIIVLFKLTLAKVVDIITYSAKYNFSTIFIPNFQQIKSTLSVSFVRVFNLKQ